MGKLNIWITGGAGFLGSRLCRTFAGQGHSVLSLDLRAPTDGQRGEIVDLSDEAAPERLGRLKEQHGGPDVIVHVAATTFARGAKTPPTAGGYAKANVLATARLCDAVEVLAPTRLIYTSTLSVYEEQIPIPVSERQAPCPTSVYTITKLASEQLLWNGPRQPKVVILRLPSLFGHGQADSFIDGLIRQARSGRAIELYSRGRTVRDTLHVDDVIGAIGACLDCGLDERRLLLHLGCGERLATIDYARLIVQAFSSQSALVPVDTPSPQSLDLFADISLARQRIGFSPMPMERALLHYAEELRAQP